LQTVGPALLGVALSDDYAQGVERAGGIPVVIPYVEDPETVRLLARRLDGLLLAGGEDVDPARYGESPRVGLGTVIPERDELELRLFHEMMALGKPILGICRGIQLINVALGGTLYQDLPREWSGRTAHNQKARRDHVSHAVRVKPGTRLSSLLGGREQLHCNSFHHQAIRDLGHGLMPVAWDEDGLVEGVEHTLHPFLVAVQWHPENLWRRYPEFAGLFQGLVAAAQSCAAG
jgi:putative glutamine amidotransferase